MVGAAGDLHCVYVNVEAAQAQRENVERAIRVIVGQVASRVRASGDGFLYDAWPGIFAIFGDGAAGGVGAGAAEVTRTVIECKVLHRRHGLETTIAHGLEQTARYMDRCGSRVGHLVIFDPSRDKSWDEKVYRRAERSGALSIVVWGM